ncbi:MULTISPECIES: hypothetical protein [Halorubrum]|uniref:Uncharacterized protein n=1 Tax=Halorubrum ruber TaxID=2982524 RepID=A0A8T8LMS0_9EURY|nr:MULTISPECIES: hypothetical protein [Halorubrum]QUO48145.1 hypothetical protein J7656_01940 [Halorubrum ruber]
MRDPPSGSARSANPELGARETDETRNSDNVGLAKQEAATREADRNTDLETESERPGS